MLWAYRIIARPYTRETPFKLVFGTEAVIPVEVNLSNLRREPFNKEANEESHRLDLDFLDKVRKDSLQIKTKYKKKLTKYHDQKVKLRRFNPGELVLRKVIEVTKVPTQGKLNLTWEGLYKIVKYSRRGTYYLKLLDDKQLPRPWNVEHLKKYYC